MSEARDIALEASRERTAGFTFASGERRQGLTEVINRLDRMHSRLGDITETLDRQNVALFARDPHNEFGMSGVMTVMQKVDQHIDVLCAWARTGKKILKAAVWTIGAAGTIAGAIAAGRAAGLL
jgi:hypothetical protein